MFNGFFEGFKRGVATLPEQYNPTAYMAFYNEFGTHWIFKAKFGSAVYENTVIEDSFAAMASQHSSSSSADFGFKDNYVSASLKWSAAHNNTQSSQSLNAEKGYHKTVIGTDPAGMDANSWRAATYTNPLPIAYELYPIYSLFDYQDVCTYEFPSKDCAAIKANLITAAGNYCNWLADNTDNQVAYCTAPPPDPSYGAGEVTTNWDQGVVSEWIFPWKATSSTWFVAYQDKKEGVVALCTSTKTGGQSCATDKADGEQLVQMDVPGVMNCIEVDFRQNHGVEAIRFGYTLVDNPDAGV